MVTVNPENISSSSEAIWVIGGGNFGRRAVRLLQKQTPTAKFFVVDQKPIFELPPDVEIICQEGVGWLVQQRFSESFATKIIPVIPVHLAADWLKLKFEADGGRVIFEEIPANLFSQLPHPIRIRSDKVVISHADFICPETCSEPDEICSYTHKKRPPPLYNLLQKMDCGDLTPIIIRSRQFAPGVGGFFLRDLWDLLNQAKSLPGVPLIIGSACKCHGVLDSFSYRTA